MTSPCVEGCCLLLLFAAACARLTWSISDCNASQVVRRDLCNTKYAASSDHPTSFSVPLCCECCWKSLLIPVSRVGRHLGVESTTLSMMSIRGATQGVLTLPAPLGASVHNSCQSRSSAEHHRHAVELDWTRLLDSVRRRIVGWSRRLCRTFRESSQGEHALAWLLKQMLQSFHAAPPSKLFGISRRRVSIKDVCAVFRVAA